jgi:hypothetical protein
LFVHLFLRTHCSPLAIVYCTTHCAGAAVHRRQQPDRRRVLGCAPARRRAVLRVSAAHDIRCVVSSVDTSVRIRIAFPRTGRAGDGGQRVAAHVHVQPGKQRVSGPSSLSVDTHRQHVDGATQPHHPDGPTTAGESTCKQLDVLVHDPRAMLPGAVVCERVPVERPRSRQAGACVCIAYLIRSST